MALVTEPFVGALRGSARVRGHGEPPMVVYPGDVEDLDAAKVAALTLGALDTIVAGWCDR